MKPLACLLISAALLSGCASKSDRATTTKSAGAASSQQVKENDAPVVKAALPVRLDLTFSSALIEALDAGNWQPEVHAELYGHPKSQTGSGAGHVELGEESHLLTTRNQSITLAGRFDAARMARLIKGEPRMKISLSVAGSDPARPEIYCSGFDEPLPLLAETGGHIHCELFER